MGSTNTDTQLKQTRIFSHTTKVVSHRQTVIQYVSKVVLQQHVSSCAAQLLIRMNSLTHFLMADILGWFLRSAWEKLCANTWGKAICGKLISNEPSFCLLPCHFSILSQVIPSTLMVLLIILVTISCSQRLFLDESWGNILCVIATFSVFMPCSCCCF